MTPLTTIEEFV